jgi:hypothetical protein
MNSAPYFSLKKVCTLPGVHALHRLAAVLLPTWVVEHGPVLHVLFGLGYQLTLDGKLGVCEMERILNEPKAFSKIDLKQRPVWRQCKFTPYYNIKKTLNQSRHSSMMQRLCEGSDTVRGEPEPGILV